MTCSILTVTTFLFVALVETVSLFLFAVTITVFRSVVNEAIQIIVCNLRSIAIPSRRSTCFKLSVLLLSAIIASRSIHHLDLFAIVPVLSCVLLQNVSYTRV